MPASVYAKPARPGLIVRRDDNRQPIPDGGALLMRTRYVERRLRDGDLVECASPADPESPPKAASKTATPKEADR